MRSPAPLAALAGLLLSGCAAEDGFSPDPYFLDLDRLERLTASTYANFEWAIAEGGVDPVALSDRSRAALAAANSHDEAVRALHDFVDAFGDGHFRLRPAPGGEPGTSGETAPPGRETPAGEACGRLGYEEHDQSFRMDFGERFHLATAADDPFPAGWLEREDGSRVGILRIDEFGAERFGEYCPETWDGYRQRLEGPCADFQCRHAFKLEIVERLLDEIVLRIERLAAEGIAALAIDISGNGGGSDWVDPVARLLTTRTLPGNDRSVVRHPHWHGILLEMKGDVERDLGRPDLGPEQRAYLTEVRDRLARGIEQAAEPCDLSAVWREMPAALPCSLLVRNTLFTTGLVAAPPSVPLDGLTVGETLFKALAYRARPPAWSGPLAVIVDRYTASASELFSALLRDNEAAITVGETTFGVGCGYTDGGIQTTLEQSGLVVWLPDCVRHRRDGGNERAGIRPDLPVAWERGEDAAARGRKLVAALGSWR